jgi:DNA-binding Xre family transcriptional regulator
MLGIRKDPATQLKTLMVQRDINVNELADMTGLHPTTITALRTGRTRQPNPDTALLIARALGVKTSTIWPDR